MFGCNYPMNLNSLGHCICVHQGKDSNPVPPDSESTTLPMIYPGLAIWQFSRYLGYFSLDCQYDNVHRHTFVIPLRRNGNAHRHVKIVSQ